MVSRVAGFDSAESRDAAFGIPTIFSIDTGTLLQHPITAGRTTSESVTSIRSFTGQAFQAPNSAQPLMVLPDHFVLLMPQKAGNLDQTREQFQSAAGFKARSCHLVPVVLRFLVKLPCSQPN